MHNKPCEFRIQIDEININTFGQQQIIFSVEAKKVVKIFGWEKNVRGIEYNGA